MENGECALIQENFNLFDVAVLFFFGGFGALILNITALWKFLIPLRRAVKSVQDAVQNDPV